MNNYYFIKGGGYYDKQLDILSDFLDKKGYSEILFMFNKISDCNKTYFREWFVKKYGKSNFNIFEKKRRLDVGNGKTLNYGTLKTKGFDIDDYEVTVSIYAYIDNILKVDGYMYYGKDHILLYWIQDDPDLDEWVSILHGESIIDEEHIEPVSLDLSKDIIDELSDIKSVNVGDGGIHHLDQERIKHVIKTLNRKIKQVDRKTFLSYLINEVGFSAIDADNAAHKVRKYL